MREKSSDNVFIYFLVLNLFDRGKTSSMGRESGPMAKSYRNIKNLKFSRRGPDPHPHMQKITEDCYNDNWAKKKCALQAT